MPLLFTSCISLGEMKKRTLKTHVVKHKNERWKIKTFDGRGKGKGTDYQDINGNRSFFHNLLLTKSLFIADLTYEHIFLTEILKKLFILKYFPL